MLPKAIDQIKEEDLLALKDNAVIERKTLEYKQALPGGSDLEKREFLADVSSFANASGGDLLYGVSEDKETGAPKAIDGFDIENIDKEKQRLDNMIRDGISPRIPSLTIHPVKLANSRVVIIIRIPKSWVSPHSVVNGKYHAFYSRNSSGKYPLDIGEIRVAFALSETVNEKIKNFRRDRIANIVANETPVVMNNNPKIILHLIPINSLSSLQNYDIDRIYSDTTKLKPIYCGGWNTRYNLDGILAYAWDSEKISYSYVQLYRNGVIEAVETSLLEPYKGRKIIPSIAYEQKLVESLTGYINVIKELNVSLPLFISITLTNVKEYSMNVGENFFGREIYPIDRDILMAAENIIEDFNVKADKILKPCFDSIWNACGFPKSLNYSDTGEWKPRR